MALAATLQGGSFSGSFFGGKTFYNIPGMAFLEEARVGVKVDALQKISKIIDQSQNQLDVSQYLVSAQPILNAESGTPAIEFADGVAQRLQSELSTKLNFLHDGTPWYLALVVKFVPGTAGSGINYSIISTSRISAEAGIRIHIWNAVDPVKIGIRLNNGTAAVITADALGYAPMGVHLLEFISNGYKADGLNDLELYVDTMLAGSVATSSNNLPNTDTDLERYIQLGSVVAYHNFFKIAYNFSGLALFERQQYITEIRELIYQRYGSILPTPTP